MLTAAINSSGTTLPATSPILLLPRPALAAAARPLSAPLLLFSSGCSGGCSLVFNLLQQRQLLAHDSFLTLDVSKRPHLRLLLDVPLV
jgi:hypothetical protein